MRLSYYTLRNLFIPILLLFSVWGCVFCFLILHEVEDETDDTLENYKEIIIRSALRDTSLLKDHVDIMTRYYIHEVSEKEAKLHKDEFYDSTVYMEIEDEDEPVRVLRTYFRANGNRYYELVLEISTLEQDDMIETIIGSMVALYFIMFACILYIVHRGFKKSSQPLYKLLNWLEHFHVGKENLPLDNPTPIKEYQILNRAVEESAKRSDRLYNEQKQFVENAAHELQTPLAICVNKLELLSEHPDCTESQLQEIAGLHQALQGIIHLNKTLLLLTRIDNKQFPDTQKICLNNTIHHYAEDISDIYENKKIQLHFSERERLICTMNESLAPTLITNLLKNAFVHNVEGGRIEITTFSKRLVIANTGVNEPLHTDRLFNRFSRQSDKKESTGLGLAIVKSIADLYGWRIDYQYMNKMHYFSLFFR